MSIATYLHPGRVAGFEWDRGNREKSQRHGVSIAAIESAFRRAITVFPDIAHSQDEERFKAIGRTEEGRYVLIVFALRTRDGETRIRPISARHMHRREIAYYEEAAAELGDR
jgi:uncharacterized DUF497 family protein